MFKTQTARHGLQAESDSTCRAPTASPPRSSTRRLVERLREHAEDLGSAAELEGIEDLVRNGNGAERQVVVYEANHDLRGAMARCMERGGGPSFSGPARDAAAEHQHEHQSAEVQEAARALATRPSTRTLRPSSTSAGRSCTVCVRTPSAPATRSSWPSYPPRRAAPTRSPGEALPEATGSRVGCRDRGRPGPSAPTRERAAGDRRRRGDRRPQGGAGRRARRRARGSINEQRPKRRAGPVRRLLLGERGRTIAAEAGAPWFLILLLISGELSSCAPRAAGVAGGPSARRPSRSGAHAEGEMAVAEDDIRELTTTSSARARRRQTEEAYLRALDHYKRADRSLRTAGSVEELRTVAETAADGGGVMGSARAELEEPREARRAGRHASSTRATDRRPCATWTSRRPAARSARCRSARPARRGSRTARSQSRAARSCAAARLLGGAGGAGYYGGAFGGFGPGLLGGLLIGCDVGHARVGRRLRRRWDGRRGRRFRRWGWLRRRRLRWRRRSFGGGDF